MPRRVPGSRNTKPYHKRVRDEFIEKWFSRPYQAKAWKDEEQTVLDQFMDTVPEVPSIYKVPLRDRPKLNSEE